MTRHTFTDWRPRQRPSRAALEGRYCRLERLDPVRHGDQLYEASMAPGADERFRYVSDIPQDRGGFAAWLAAAAASQDPLFYAVLDRSSGRCEGRQSLKHITPEHGVIEVGNVLWGPAIARTRVTTEALFLFVQYAFDELGYRRVEWMCNVRNERSMRAARCFGFTYEGTFRQHRVAKGHNRDTAWWAIIDRDWPPIRNAFEQWLQPDNFDARGQQKLRLEGYRSRR